MTLGKDKIQFLNTPTPLHRLDRISEDLGVEFYLKRDDLTNFGTGGGNGLTVNVHSVTTLDGRTLSQSVSQHQADQLNQMNRSGGVLE